MSKLEELIQQYCLEGVGYKTLSDITSAVNIGINPRKFFQLNPSDSIGFYVTVRELSGLNGVKRYPKTDLINQKAIDIIQSRANIEEGDILFSNTGTVGKLALVNEKPEKWGVNEGIYVIKPIKSVVTSKFLFYYLDSSYAYRDYSSKFTGSTLKHVTQQALLSLEVPVPPMEVQREIVHILDSFTFYTSELSAELSARREQYNYYRNRLLTFDDKTEWKTLGNIGKVSMCKRIMKNETSLEGDVPFYKIGTFGKQADAYISWAIFKKYKSMYSFPKKGDILISAAGTIGRAVVYDGEPAYFQDSNIVWIANDESQVLNEFLYYWYQTNPWRVSTGGTISRLYNDNIASAKIPVIPIEDQRRLVHVLNNFDAICADLETGLPAEIEARQKQYEYYRDKLLNFKRIN